MGTTANQSVGIGTKHFVKEKQESVSWFTKQAEKFEAGRFFWMSLLITVQTCLGSIACGYILQNTESVFMLSAGALLTMGANAVMIAQAPAKICLAMAYLSILANTLFILVNVLH
jgi:hypothetical protein